MATMASSSLASPAAVLCSAAAITQWWQVLVEQAEPDALQRLGDRRDLGEHVDAVLVVLDHPLQPAHLAFDAAQPAEVVVLADGVAPCRHDGA